jgi:hypothetical protein
MNTLSVSLAHESLDIRSSEGEMGIVIMTNKGGAVRKGAVDEKTLKVIADALGINKAQFSAGIKSVYIYRGTKRAAKRRAKR